MERNFSGIVAVDDAMESGHTGEETGHGTPGLQTETEKSGALVSPVAGD